MGEVLALLGLLVLVTTLVVNSIMIWEKAQNMMIWKKVQNMIIWAKAQNMMIWKKVQKWRKQVRRQKPQPPMQSK